jgi:hypothetical protein
MNPAEDDAEPTRCGGTTEPRGGEEARSDTHGR